MFYLDAHAEIINGVTYISLTIKPENYLLIVTGGT
jgi:hypothetical protein